MSISVDFTNKYGNDLKNFIIDSYKYNIVVKSKPYNDNGAYFPLDNTYIDKNHELYLHLTKNGFIKDLYVEYYNYIKLNNLKNKKIPIISIDMIDSIIIYQLPINYIHYSMR